MIERIRSISIFTLISSSELKWNKIPELTKSIIGRGTTAQLINYYQWLLTGSFQDRCSFKHFLHEGRNPTDLWKKAHVNHFLITTEVQEIASSAKSHNSQMHKFSVEQLVENFRTAVPRKVIFILSAEVFRYSFSNYFG